MAAQIVFRTSGQVSAIVGTTNQMPLVTTSKAGQIFLTTTNSKSIFQTGKIFSTLFKTTSSNPIFKTSGTAVVFLTLPPIAPKQLILKIGDLEFNSDYTILNVPDATGEYDPIDPNLNPGGYNPELENTNPYRPKRSQVKLWTVYRIWDVPGYGSKTQFPDTATELANENEVNYEFPLTMPTKQVNGTSEVIKGIYQIALIAAPISQDYDAQKGKDNLIDQATSYPDWYVTSAGIMVDADVVNCLNQKRYKYLQGVMCGSCNDDYLEFYSKYLGMLSAMDVQDWTTAICLYEKLKQICSETKCDTCQCYSCDC